MTGGTLKKKAVRRDSMRERGGKKKQGLDPTPGRQGGESEREKLYDCMVWGRERKPPYRSGVDQEKKGDSGRSGRKKEERASARLLLVGGKEFFSFPIEKNLLSKRKETGKSPGAETEGEKKKKGALLPFRLIKCKRGNLDKTGFAKKKTPSRQRREKKAEEAHR